ncbi:hypothetical protein OG539_15975 [Actinacidiphila glaucinigra]|uniref:hypothetical protein n=1 Tax=Actinacidiphila glaucinigra TaxID=235986 RepID=UPI002DD8DD38|nr:hypothetical protein [Actinacidiphila glaucinigra]WSD65527.1 hypothetical protein OIE69_26760 [Actinacidiphila glaucinigra]
MPLSDTGGRVVRVENEILGTAYRMADLVEFLRRAGLDADMADVVDPEVIDWRGGGPDVWS